jgi:hypothetical protein
MSAFGLTLLLLAGDVAGPPAPKAAPPPPQAPPAAPAPACEDRQQREGEIVICAQKPNGYRLDPDVLEAKRQYRGSKRKRPENFVHNDCATVGPMGCRGGPTINLIGAALTAAEMAKRIAQGKEIGSMFITDPHPSEYQLYVAAKHRREAEQAAAAAAAKAKADAAKAPPPPADLTATATVPAPSN